MRIVLREKDLIQAGLIFGLPVYIFLVGFLSIKLSRALVGLPASPWGPIAKSFGIFLTFLVIGLGFYLFYWLWRIVKFKKRVRPLQGTDPSQLLR